MNIFYLHPDPVKASTYHYNRHVVKMPLEAAQMLCTAHHVIGEEYDYEGYMVRTQLRRMEAQASELIKMIEDDEQFPAWLQSKVTLASEYMDTVYDFYKYSDYSITSNESEDDD